MYINPILFLLGLGFIGVFKDGFYRGGFSLKNAWSRSTGAARERKRKDGPGPPKGPKRRTEERYARSDDRGPRNQVPVAL